MSCKDDFIHAFNRAVKLRTDDLAPTGRPLFVGLSSGFDSGAIHASLHQQVQPAPFWIMLARAGLSVGGRGITEGSHREQSRMWSLISATGCG